MPYDPLDSMSSIRAAMRRMSAFELVGNQSVLDQLAIAATPATFFKDYQATMLGAAGLPHNLAAQFASNWEIADSFLSAGKLDALQSSLSSAEAVRQALSSLQMPKFQPFQSLMLADFAHGSSALHTVGEILSSTGANPLLEQQGRLLSESYTSFVDGLASSAVSGVLGSAGLSAATANVERSGAVLASLAEVDFSVEADPFTPARPNWFEVFREELEDRPEDLETLSPEAAAQVVAATAAARLAAVAGQINTLMFEINRDVETVSGEAIFKPTIKGQYVAGMLGLQSVTSRDGFDQFAMGLFYLIYEASGEWNRIATYEPRFPKVADRIKHFRLYAAHDTQHGNRAAIRKKAIQVGAHLTDLIGHPIPRSSEDWLEAQLALLAEVASFLRHLHECVLNTSPSA